MRKTNLPSSLRTFRYRVNCRVEANYTKCAKWFYGDEKKIHPMGSGIAATVDSYNFIISLHVATVTYLSNYPDSKKKTRFFPLRECESWFA